MSLPPISPTGALSSGNYVDYMIGYLNGAMDDMASDLKKYSAGSTLTDWGTKWSRIVNDINTTVVALESDINKIQAQIGMVSDALSKM